MSLRMEEHKGIDYTEQLEGLVSVLNELEFLDLLNTNVSRIFYPLDIIVRCIGGCGLSSCERVNLFIRSFLRHIYDDKYPSWDYVASAIAVDWHDKIIKDVYFSGRDRLIVLSEYEQLVNAIKQVLGYYRWQSSRSDELNQQIIEMYERFDKEKDDK